MNITGHVKLMAQLRKMPVKAQHRVAGTIRRQTEKTAAIARAFAPEFEGYTKGDIYTRFSFDGLTGWVEATDDSRESQIRAMAIEFGRKKGIRGTTYPQPYIRPAVKFMGPKFRKAIRAAIKRAMKDSVNG